MKNFAVISYSASGGGSESYIRRTLQDNKISCQWYYLSDDSSQSNTDYITYVPLGSLPSIRSFYFLKYFIQSVFSILSNKNSIKIISFGFYPSIIAFFISLCKSSSWWTMTQREEYTWANSIHISILNLLKIFCNTLEVNSLHLYNINMKNPFLKNKTYLSSNAFFSHNNQSFTELPSHFQSIRSSYSTIFVYVANNRPVKNTNLAVKSLYHLASLSSDILCVVIGKGYDPQYLCMSINISEQTNLLFTGQLDQSVVSKYLQIADVALSTSLSEGSSFYLFESLFKGCALVVSNIPSNTEYVDHGINGYIFDTLNPYQLTDLLFSLHQSSSLLSSMKFSSLNRITSLTLSSPHHFAAIPLTSGYTFIPSSSLVI